MSRFAGSHRRPAERQAVFPEEHAGSCDAAQSLQAGAQTPDVQVALFSKMNEGGRHDNEDRWMSAKEDFPEKGGSFYTIGVLDGHDTEEASDLVSKFLPGVVGKKLQQAGMPVAEAYKLSCAELEDKLKDMGVSSAGTCVLSCTISGKSVWCSNLGDCRAALVHVLDPEEKAVRPKVAGLTWMSRDHKASAAYETARIKAAGGQVIDGRVEGLEPSRTLGDFDVKAQVKAGVISIEPEVRQHHLGAGVGAGTRQAILVCATDGVWDVISGQDVCHLVTARKELVACQKMTAMIVDEKCQTRAKCDLEPLKELAEDLVQYSVQKGSKDDCTAIVALISVPASKGDAPPPGRSRSKGRSG